MQVKNNLPTNSNFPFCFTQMLMICTNCSKFFVDELPEVGALKFCKMYLLLLDAWSDFVTEWNRKVSTYNPRDTSPHFIRDFHALRDKIIHYCVDILLILPIGGQLTSDQIRYTIYGPECTDLFFNLISVVYQCCADLRREKTWRYGLLNIRRDLVGPWIEANVALRSTLLVSPCLQGQVQILTSARWRSPSL